jgi:hypothetical protein
MDSAAGNAYKQMTISNALYAGAATGVPTNETRVPALLGGALGSLSLSNLYGATAAHNLPTNGDRVAVLTENGRAVKGMTLETVFSGQTGGTNFDGDHVIVSWDGTRLRGNRATNFIDGLTTTNTAPQTNAALVVLEDGALKKLFLNELRPLMKRENMVQSTYLLTTNIAGSSGNWSNIAAQGTSVLSNSITPWSTASRVLVRVIMHGASAGAGDKGMMRVTRNGTAIGVGATAGSRTSAGAVIPNSSDVWPIVWEFLDSPASAAAVSYVVQVTAASGNTVYVNRSSTDTDSANVPRPISSITLTEIFP